MSNETADCLVDRRRADRAARRPGTAPYSPGAVVPEAASWTGGGILSPLYPRRYADTVTVPASGARRPTRNPLAKSPRTAASIRGGTWRVVDPGCRRDAMGTTRIRRSG